MPLVRLLSRLGVTPNGLTTVGAILILVAAGAFAVGSMRWGGALLLLSGMVDTLDGQVARLYGKASTFGAFYDSTLDRVGDGALFIGLVFYFRGVADLPGGVTIEVITLLALLATQLVSYMRARAEGLGLDCRVGVAQRAERILGLGLPALILGSAPMVLAGVVTILMVLSFITVGQRFAHVHRVADRPAAQ